MVHDGSLTRIPKFGEHIQQSLNAKMPDGGCVTATSRSASITAAVSILIHRFFSPAAAGLRDTAAVLIRSGFTRWGGTQSGQPVGKRLMTRRFGADKDWNRNQNSVVQPRMDTKKHE